MPEAIHAPSQPVQIVAESLVVHPEGNRVLLVRKPNGCTLPGGGVESGESVAAAAPRETMEETGVDVAVTGIVAVTEQHRDDRVILFFTMRADYLTGAPSVLDDDDGEIVEAFWADLDDLDALIPWLDGLDLPLRELAVDPTTAPYRHRIEGQR